jgi:hypothetical protein
MHYIIDGKLGISRWDLLKKEATMGFEPMIRVLQTLALATWPRRRA